MLAKLRTLQNILFHLATAWNHSFRFGGFLRHEVEAVKNREPNFYETLSAVLLGRAPSRVCSWKYNYTNCRVVMSRVMRPKHMLIMSLLWLGRLGEVQLFS